MKAISNDVKYNKIREIEEMLSPYIFSAIQSWYEDDKEYSFGDILRQWKRERRELANRIYNISLMGLISDNEDDEYEDSEYPIHWKNVIDEINYNYKWKKYQSPDRLYNCRDRMWESYDYLNS
ncbi:hypothetical protein [Scytonema sp. NUACC26]|uniref:hypothetical protein n=1 Tax=Scytonema sp. NUACC26 TaxID=3140176 RepID=UPI0034DC3C46